MQSQRTAKLTAKVPKIRSFSKIVVHNFYGVINSRFEEFRSRNRKSKDIAAFFKIE